MRIVVASGKGGTGKTTIAVGLALYLVEQGKRVHLLDADVEEPNAHLFLKHELDAPKEEVGYLVPRVKEELCDGCGECRSFCRFNAISIIAGKPLIFDELCHGCGGCVMVCPQKAMYEERLRLGVIEGFGKEGDRLYFRHGRLEIGKATTTPIIQHLLDKHSGKGDAITVVDAPPGTGCPVINTVRGADFALLVTEPTPFGLHDLQLAAEVVRELQIRAGVIINRADLGGTDVEAWCEENRLPVLAKIPFSREVAEGYSRGEPLLYTLPEAPNMFADLWAKIERSGSE